MSASDDPINRLQNLVFMHITLFKIDGVYQGDSIFIDWKSGLEPAIHVHYSTPAGDPLIHLAPDPVFMANFPGWGFHRFNPWRERFDEVIQRTIEAGLIDFWKQVGGR